MKHQHMISKNTMISMVILTVGGLLLGFWCATNLSQQELSYCTAFVDQLFAIPAEPFQYFLEQSVSIGCLVTLVFLCGFSMLGIPIILFLFYLKGIQIGFITSILFIVYQFKGIPAVVLILLPAVFTELFSYFLIGSASLQLSSTLLMRLTEPSKKLSMLTTINQKLSSFLVALVCAVVTGGMKSTFCLWMIQLFHQTM